MWAEPFFRKIVLSLFLPALILTISGVGRSAAAEKRTVAAYSFHGTLRCMTCLLVEQGAEKAIRDNFPGELLDGSLAWRSVNIRLPGNRHFATEYDVLSWALVLVEYRDGNPGKWRNLPLAGELVQADPDAFRRYVTSEVRSLLKNTQELKGEIK